MDNKKVWIGIGAGVILVVVLGIVYWQYQKPSEDTLADEQEAIQSVQETLEAATKSAVDIPSVNPLRDAIPDVNPLKKTNPFKVGNPFE